MEKSFGPPNSKSVKVAELRQQFWDKQPEHRTPDKYSRDEYGNSENIRAYLGELIGKHVVSEPTERVEHEQGVTHVEQFIEFEGSGDDTGRDDHSTSIETHADEMSYKKIIEGLEQIRPIYADVYKTALELFPQIGTLKRMRSIRLNPHTHESISGGIMVNATGLVHPEIIIGEAEPVLQLQKDRWIKRLGLDNSEYTQQEISALPDSFWLSYTFAHELGHAMQRDENFESIFGYKSDMNTTGSHDIVRNEGYRAYLNSANEKNADYIGMLLMSKTKTFEELLPEPSHQPHEWRTWAVDL